MTKFSKRLKIILLLMGSFTFAFLLGEMIHEWGHFLAHRYYGNQGISIHLDPFGGSRILGVKALPLCEMGITTAAGPGLNLAAGTLITAVLWHRASPALLPLVLWGPVAMIQEGVNLSLGLLSPGSDAQWLALWGVPNWLLIALGTSLILAGTALISRTLYRQALQSGISFLERLGLVFFGLGFLMILRAAVSWLSSPETALENLVPLVFALTLSLIISVIQPTSGRLWTVGDSDQTSSSGKASISAFGLGLGILLFQMIAP